MLTKDNLHAYQLRGLDRILSQTHTGLFLDMGLGKTVTTLTAINELIYYRLEADKVLIIGPKRVVESVWIQEAQKWEHLKHLKFSLVSGTASKRMQALRAKADIYLISRDNVAWLCGQYGGRSVPFDMLVIDELSSFKNHASGRFKALKLVQPSFNRVVGLTGTPAPNGFIDLWAPLYLLDRGERLGKTITAYREAYFNRSFSGFGYDIRGESAEAEISRKISDIVISMKAEDYLDLPKRVTNIIEIAMPEDVKKNYKEFEREKVLELIEEGETITAVNAAALTNKLLQYANGCIYNQDKEAISVHSLKLDALEDLLEAANGEPVLVFWAYRSEAELIEERFKAYKPRRMTNDEDVKAWNNKEIKLLLMHPASGGHGLNLQKGGNIVVWFGNTWSLELEEQANARIDRQGQTKPPVIYKLVTKGTVDERVINAIDSKASTQAFLMDSVKDLVREYAK